MNQTIVISVNVSASTSSVNSAPGLEIWVDDKIIYDIVPEPAVKTFSFEVDDSDDLEHELKFVLKNKTFDHTQIDEAGNIINDATVNINNLKFDGIELERTFNILATYTHDFNGTRPPIEDQFFNTIGCNGTVSLKFTTPVYVWLLENM